MKRQRWTSLLYLVGFIAIFFILIGLLITIRVWISSRSSTPQTQTRQAGPYQITLQVNPNPPLSTQPTTLSIRVLLSSSQQAVSHAQVIVDSNMTTMNMGTEEVEAKPQGGGSYFTRVEFSMSGPWQIGILVAPPGAKPVSAVFNVNVE